MSQVLNNSCESIYGFVSPNRCHDTFSTYRYEAIRGAVLSEYFAVAESSARDMDPFSICHALNDDLLLRWHMVTASYKAWTVHFLDSARATIRPSSNVSALINSVRYHIVSKCIVVPTRD